MPAKGSRAFTSLTPEDQQAIANGLFYKNGGNLGADASWKNGWNTNDIDNEFSMMAADQQARLLQRMNAARTMMAKQQQDYNSRRDNNDKLWAPYGGAPAGSYAVFGNGDATTGYVAKDDGSDAWKMKGQFYPDGMKNPVKIGMQYYDKPIAKAALEAPANLSGGQATVPSVQQRMMSRMGQAVQKGVSKGKINSKQLGKYQVPGQAAPASPLANQLGSPQQGQARNAILDPRDNYNPYYYKPVKPDFSSIDPNDPDEIRYQQNIKAKQEAGKNGAPVQAIAYSTKARKDIMDKTAETNRLGQERMTAARKADPRSNDIVNR